MRGIMSQRQPTQLLLIDGGYYAHRAHHAYPRMTANGAPTGALYGFANALWVLDEVYGHDTPGIVVFPTDHTFRVGLHAGYTGHRPTPPPEVALQWDALHELAQAWGFATVDCEDCEALDYFARWAAEDPRPELVLVGADRRYRGLLGPRVELFEALKGSVTTADDVLSELGIDAQRISDLVALSGDSSASIPGLPGIGEKTAAALLASHGDLDGVFAAAPTIKGKRGQILADGGDAARLSRQLAQPAPDRASIDASHADAPRRPRYAHLKQLLVTWQFRTHLTELADLLDSADGAHEAGESTSETTSESAGPGASEHPAPIDRGRYRCVASLEELDQCLAAARRAGRCAVDLETTSLDPLQAQVVGASLCWSASDAVYVPLRHRAGSQRAAGQPPLDAAWARLAAFFADASIAKTGQNLKYDTSVLRQHGVALAAIRGDTMLADYLLEPEQNRHGLDDLALRHLGHETIQFSEVTDGRPDEMSFADVSLERATEYAAEDAHVAWFLDQKLTPLLDERGLRRLYDEIEVPLVAVLADMESAGIGVDVDGLRALSVELGEKQEAVEAEIYELAGKRFSIQSPKQLAEILFDERGLEPIKRTKSGYSTDADTLEQLASRDPLPAKILEFRTLAKLKSTYVDTLPDAVSPVDGRIHTSFHQAVAATGRLSSNHPNLQNIPVRTEDGKRIRACFRAEPNHVFVSLDYSQVELRVLAHFCESGPLVESFVAGEDIHCRTAAEIFAVALEEVTPDQRRAAKAINFGIVYGMGASRLANDLRITPTDAARYLKQYFERYPEVKRVQTGLISRARQNGYAETLWGRKRAISDLSAPTQRSRGAAERIALNTPIQGSAADIIKAAMIAAHRQLTDSGLPARLLLQVHDELLVEVQEHAADEAEAIVRTAMQNAASLHVPLVVHAGRGATWAEAH